SHACPKVRSPGTPDALAPPSRHWTDQGHGWTDSRVGRQQSVTARITPNLFAGATHEPRTNRLDGSRGARHLCGRRTCKTSAKKLARSFARRTARVDVWL